MVFVLQVDADDAFVRLQLEEFEGETEEFRRALESILTAYVFEVYCLFVNCVIFCFVVVDDEISKVAGER